MPIVFMRAAFRKAPQRPVEMPIDSSSSMAVMPMPEALSLCSSCKAPSSTGTTPTILRALTPRAMTANASEKLSGGPSGLSPRVLFDPTIASLSVPALKPRTP